ncbi:MAG: HAD family hydrolase [Pseudomonadota bacterium]
MKKYRGILFDLFATLALWHPEKLPKFTYQGKTTPSTMGELKKSVVELVKKTTFDEFYEAFTQVNQAQSAFKAQHNKEISSRTRFKKTLLDIGYDEDQQTHDIAEQLSLKHMALLSSVVKIPETYGPFLRELKTDHQLALVSNFDHYPTAHKILERDGISHHFDSILISDEHGYRKPHPKIFDDALSALGLNKDDVLFVGDSWDDDVVGAQTLGIDVAWINPKNKAHGSTGHKPTLEINSILDLKARLL